MITMDLDKVRKSVAKDFDSTLLRAQAHAIVDAASQLKAAEILNADAWQQSNDLPLEQETEAKAMIRAVSDHIENASDDLARAYETLSNLDHWLSVYKDER